MRRHLKIFLSLSFVLSGCATLPAAIDRAAEAPALRGAIWGIEVQDDSGRVLYERNGHALLMPASNRKLFAASTAINCFGLDHQFATELWLDGSNVVIRGGGDPSLGGRWAADRYHENSADGMAIADPALYAAQAFRDALRDGGIEVRGTPWVSTIPRMWQERIAIIESPFLSQLAATMLKVSQNLYAEMLFKATAGTYAGAESLERMFLTNEVHVPEKEFRFVDGCGLAPDDLVTPAAIVTLLRWMNEPPRRGVYWSLLATPGEEGTLRRRVVPLASRLRGKTGTIAGVNALSGIIAGTHGGFRYFSIIINHHIAESAIATRAIDAMVHAIADF